MTEQNQEQKQEQKKETETKKEPPKTPPTIPHVDSSERINKLKKDAKGSDK